MKYNIDTNISMRSGIYSITNSLDNRFYIGSTIDFWRRYCDHKHKLKKGSHANKYLQAFSNKYGIETLSFDLLFVCKNTCLCFNEKLWIDLLKPVFNIKPIIHRPYYEDEKIFSIDQMRKQVQGADHLLETRLNNEKQLRLTA